MSAVALDLGPADRDRLPDWRDQAACAEVDRDMFFPGEGESSRPAKKVCAGCDVRAECLAFALSDPDIVGVWGGLSTRQRNALGVAS